MIRQMYILCRLFYINYIERLQILLHEYGKCNKYITVFSYDIRPSQQIAFNIFVDIIARYLGQICLYRFCPARLA